MMISKMGTGSLSWTASDAPDSLIVTPDPSQVIALTPVGTVITIQGDNGQSLGRYFK